MHALLTRKLQLSGPLSEEDERFFLSVLDAPRVMQAGEDIISEGDATKNVHLILDGFACRYKVLGNGRRQIVAFLVPGDFCDYHIFILDEMDHSIGALSTCQLVEIPRPAIVEMMARPTLARAFWWMTLVDEATLREWLVNMGQRGAVERVAHLFCELNARLESVGLSQGNRFTLPITQADLADTMGISDVHANRSLQELRRQGLITLRSKELIINDLSRLQAISGFNPNYLHLKGGKRDRQVVGRSPAEGSGS